MCLQNLSFLLLSLSPLFGLAVFWSAKFYLMLFYLESVHSVIAHWDDLIFFWSVCVKLMYIGCNDDPSDWELELQLFLFRSRWYLLWCAVPLSNMRHIGFELVFICFMKFVCGNDDLPDWELELCPCQKHMRTSAVMFCSSWNMWHIGFELVFIRLINFLWICTVKAYGYKCILILDRKYKVLIHYYLVAFHCWFGHCFTDMWCC